MVRGDNCIEIHHKNKVVDKFDHVILATHSDTSLKLLESPSKLEQEILGNINYQKNLMVLHSDVDFMPRRKNAWSSWVYLSNSNNSEKQVSLSYWMNNLQRLHTSTPIGATLGFGEYPTLRENYPTLSLLS